MCLRDIVLHIFVTRGSFAILERVHVAQYIFFW